MIPTVNGACVMARKLTNSARADSRQRRIAERQRTITPITTSLTFVPVSRRGISAFAARSAAFDSCAASACPDRARRPRSRATSCASTIAPAASVAPSRPSVPAASSVMPAAVVAGLVQHARRGERELLAAAATAGPRRLRRRRASPSSRRPTTKHASFAPRDATLDQLPARSPRRRARLRRSSRSGAMLDREPTLVARFDAAPSSASRLFPMTRAGDVRERRMRLRRRLGIVPRLTPVR